MQVFIDMLKLRLKDDKQVMNLLIDPIDTQAKLIEATQDNDPATMLDVLSNGIINLMTIAAKNDLPLEQMVAAKLVGTKHTSDDVVKLYAEGKLPTNKTPATTLEKAIAALRLAKDQQAEQPAAAAPADTKKPAKKK